MRPVSANDRPEFCAGHQAEGFISFSVVSLAQVLFSRIEHKQSCLLSEACMWWPNRDGSASVSHSAGLSRLHGVATPGHQSAHRVHKASRYRHQSCEQAAARGRKRLNSMGEGSREHKSPRLEYVVPESLHAARAWH